MEQESKNSIARSKDIPSSTNLPGNGARKDLSLRRVSAAYLASSTMAPEKSLMSNTKTSSCRRVLGLQAQSFVGQ